jgi:hypothetical protein
LRKLTMKNSHCIVFHSLKATDTFSSAASLARSYWLACFVASRWA